MDIRFPPAFVCTKTVWWKNVSSLAIFCGWAANKELEIHVVKSFRKAHLIDAKEAIRRKGQRCAWDYNWRYWRLFERPPGKQLKSTLVIPLVGVCHCYHHMFVPHVHRLLSHDAIVAPIRSSYKCKHLCIFVGSLRQSGNGLENQNP